MLTRHPLLGMDFRAYQKIWRLVGVDQLHVNGIQNKFWESDDSVVSSIGAMMQPLGKQLDPLSVVSSGQWGGQAFETWRRTETTDLLYMAGGGILAHPMGPQAGVKALQQAWDAAVEGLTMEEAIAEFPEFAASAQKFSKQ
jgi:ribulose-bisphosphate carboxylase large chain